MTLFTGCLVLHARRIEASRHCVTCLPVMSRAEMQACRRHKCCIALCCGQRPRTFNDEAGVCKPISRAFHTVYPRLLLHWVTKTVVVILFLVYICVSIAAVTRIETGFRFHSIVPDDSELSQFLAAKHALYLEKGPVLTLAIVKPVDYHKLETRDSIKDALKSAQQLDGVIDNVTVTWLDEFQRFLRANNESRPQTEAKYIKLLNDKF